MHLLLHGLMGVLLGWMAVPALFVWCRCAADRGRGGLEPGVQRPVLAAQRIPASIRSRWLVALVFFIGAAPALAHKLTVFAAVEGQDITGIVYFAGGNPAPGARIQITDAQGAPLAELQPGKDGRFRYQAQAPVAHRVIATTADGHRAEWRIAAEELVAATGTLEAALARQLRPLREELLATRDALRFQDILGGIGYIFGLTGLALWWRCRRCQPHRPDP